MSSIILSTPYALDGVLPNKWSATQEKVIRRDYPFTDLASEDADQYVIRAYLQFLWLPESIMPIQLFVPSLLRVASTIPTQSSQDIHPLHALIEPLLLTTRLSSSKYHTELPQILAQGGGAGEQEETMMWYAYGYEKTGGDGEEGVEGDEHEYQRRWMERLERREAQLQILLHMLKLSLPGPCPELTAPPPSPAKKPKKRKRTEIAPAPPQPSTADRLESFMDKLSMWQLLATVQSTEMQILAGECARDWQQRFYEDIVEPEFKAKLPDTCALLHSKIFPDSPFADDSSRSSSPTTDVDDPPARASSKDPSARAPLARSRSSSLSVTLAQDKERAASERRTRRAFSREVSMSRVFKEKSAPPEKGKERGKEKEKPKPREKAERTGTTLVAATPTKRKAVRRMVGEGNGEEWGMSD